MVGSIAGQQARSQAMEELRKTIGFLSTEAQEVSLWLDQPARFHPFINSLFYSIFRLLIHSFVNLSIRLFIHFSFSLSLSLTFRALSFSRWSTSTNTRNTWHSWTQCLLRSCWSWCGILARPHDSTKLKCLRTNHPSQMQSRNLSRAKKTKRFIRGLRRISQKKWNSLKKKKYFEVFFIPTVSFAAGVLCKAIMSSVLDDF